ncbi:MAG: anthranilate synthase component I family protein [Nitrospirae bacterium]|nr:anthranilate synthase component I family protein [Nitrospirota bacterium]
MITKTEFIKKAGSGNIPPIYLEIDCLNPSDLYEHLKNSGAAGKYSVLLQSSGGVSPISRYSFICIDPYIFYCVKDGEVSITSLAGSRSSVSFRNPLDRLSEIVNSYKQSPVSGLPPFQGGAVGLFSYDFVRYVEDISLYAADDIGIPDAVFIMVDLVVAYDHYEARAWIIAAPAASMTELGYRDINENDLSSAYDEALMRINSLKSLCVSASEQPNKFCVSTSEPFFEMSKDYFKNMVMRAKDYIAAGDIFQANLSQRIRADIGETDPWHIYRKLTSINPSPFGLYADLGELKLVSSSPERLVRLRGNIIDTRPIAGTRPRGRSKSEDEGLRAELLLNEKERAEHIMLIDLERNDIGRVCRYGTVNVDELMITEDYSHVMHIVSNVRGELMVGRTAFNAIKAVFPGGTITGVPKVRCMQIIDELEPVRRGPYCGSFGYIGFNGNMDLNIVIRTFAIKDATAYIQAGAGIVADSDPDREYNETIKKAEALLKTLLN